MYEASRGAISGLDPNGPHELALEMSRTMLPSGFLFLRGLPNLHCVSWLESDAGWWRKSVPHRRGVVAANVHVATALARRSNLVTLDLRTRTSIA